MDIFTGECERPLYGQCAYCRGPLTPEHDCPEKRQFKKMSQEIAQLAVETAKKPAKRKGNYIGAPAVFALELACKHLLRAFGHYGMYQVGSSLERADWRDVDVRYIMEDAEFAKLFPDAGDNWEFDERWLILTVAISGWLEKQTGLPVDFQFQPQTHANERHKGARSALGITITKRSSEIGGGNHG